MAENKENGGGLAKEDDSVDDLLRSTMSVGHVSLLARVLDLEAKEAERRREFAISTQLIRGIQKRMELMQGSICDQFEQLDNYCGTMSNDILAELKQEMDRLLASQQIDNVRAEVVQSGQRLDALEANAAKSPMTTATTIATDVTTAQWPVGVNEFASAFQRLHDKVENLETTVSDNGRALERMADPVDEVRVRLEELRLECLATTAKSVQDMQARMDEFVSRLDACLPSGKTTLPAQSPEVREAVVSKTVYDGKSRSLSPRTCRMSKTTSYITSTPQRQTSRVAVTPSGPSAGSVSLASRRSICVRPPDNNASAVNNAGSPREPREASVGPPKRFAVGEPICRGGTDSPTPMTPINYTVPKDDQAQQPEAPAGAEPASRQGIRNQSPPNIVSFRGMSPRDPVADKQGCSVSRSKSGPSTASAMQPPQTAGTQQQPQTAASSQTRRASPQLRYGQPLVAQPVSVQGLQADRGYKLLSTVGHSPRTLTEQTPRSPNEVIQRFWSTYHNS